jgi:aldehyde dehydrogenase (NAD+)
MPTSSLKDEALALLSRLGVNAARLEGGPLAATTPITGETLARLDEISAADATARIGDAHAAFLEWRKVPAPRRGELIRLFGDELRAAKADSAVW